VSRLRTTTFLREGVVFLPVPCTANKILFSMNSLWFLFMYVTYTNGVQTHQGSRHLSVLYVNQRHPSPFVDDTENCQLLCKGVGRETDENGWNFILQFISYVAEGEGVSAQIVFQKSP
jgi:hypothetical protein